MSKSKTIKGGGLWFGIAVFVAVLTAGAIFIVLDQASKEETFYVLNQPLQDKVLVTEDMLTPVTTKAGSVPNNFIDISTIREGGTFTRFSLAEGEPLTVSNSGSLIPLQDDIPDTYVLASFVVDPSMAAAGNIQRGSYIDIISKTESEMGSTTKFVLRNVKVVDTNSTNDGTPPSLYTVGVTTEDAAKLALLSDQFLYVVLSPLVNIDGVKDTKDDIRANLSDVFNFEGVGDSGFSSTPVTETEEDVDPSVGENPAVESPVEEDDVEVVG